jgi:iron complex outermembrane recepter protein
MTEVSSTSTLSGKEVEDFHAENLTDVLNTIPGVTARKNEGDSSKIHIRGIATEVYMGEKPGVAIVIDGVPVQERAGSVNIDSDNIASIKVLKGGASYLYGNDALAGAIIITTKRPKNKNEGFATVEQGSYGYAKYLASYNVGTENFATNVQASYKKSDGYWNNSDYYTKSINGKFQYYIDDTSDITFGVDKTIRYENDTGSITYADYNPTTLAYIYNVETNPKSVGEVGYATNYDIDLTKLFITYSKDFDHGANLMAQIYQYDDVTENFSSPYDSSTPSDGINDDHKYLSHAHTLQRGFKSEYRLEGKKIAGMLGLDIARNEEDKKSTYRVNYSSGWSSGSIGDVTSDTSGKENINAMYGELKFKPLKNFVTTLNARYDNITYDYKNNLDNNSAEKRFDELSYRAGATYDIADKQVLFASISTGFRVPLLSQLYAKDMASYGSYNNNPDIKTEKTINYEIGFRHQTPWLSYEASLFQLNRNDVIVRDSGNYVTDPTPGAATTYGNFADIENRGFELGLNSNRNKDAFLVLNYSYLNSKYTRFDEYKLILNGAVDSVYSLAGNRVPRTSNHTLYVEGNYRVIPSVLLTADTTYRSSQYADDLNQVKVDGYALVNLRAKYNTEISNFDLELFARLDNVFDKQYYMMPRVTGDRNEDGIYDIRDMGLTVNPGRTFLAGLSAKF